MRPNTEKSLTRSEFKEEYTMMTLVLLDLCAFIALVVAWVVLPVNGQKVERTTAQEAFAPAS
jgi:hypothetical protein